LNETELTVGSTFLGYLYFCPYKVVFHFSHYYLYCHLHITV